MKELLLPSSIICLLFFVSFMRDPDILWKTLMFKYNNELRDRVASVGMWVFLAGSVTAIVLLCDILKGVL